MSNAVILTSDGSNLTAEEDRAVKTFADMTGVELDLREIDLPRHGWMLNRIRSCERILEPPPDSSDYGVEVTRLPISRADFIFYNLELASNSEWVITVDKASAQLLQSVFRPNRLAIFNGSAQRRARQPRECSRLSRIRT